MEALLVDDAQELTPAASELIFALSQFGAGVSFFGDPDVATLSFRVANPKSMTLLAERIARSKDEVAKTIYLEPEHRIRPAGISLALEQVPHGTAPHKTIRYCSLSIRSKSTCTCSGTDKSSLIVGISCL